MNRTRITSGLPAVPRGGSRRRSRRQRGTSSQHALHTSYAARQAAFSIRVSLHLHLLADEYMVSRVTASEFTLD